jgi:hypothetical protein
MGPGRARPSSIRERLETASRLAMYGSVAPWRSGTARPVPVRDRTH